jgi:hypothetical protein
MPDQHSCNLLSEDPERETIHDAMKGRIQRELQEHTALNTLRESFP